MGAPTTARFSIRVALSSSATIPDLGGEGEVGRGARPALSPVPPRASSSLGRHVNVDVDTGRGAEAASSTGRLP